MTTPELIDAIQVDCQQAISFTYPKPSQAFLQFCQQQSAPVKLNANARCVLGNDYFRQNYPGTSDTVYLRSALAVQLQRVLEALPETVGIYLFDGYRSIETQWALYHEFVAEIQQQHPDWSETAVIEEALKFVSHPTDTNRFPVPLHNTGGAIDLTLFDVATGEHWDMGTEIDALTSLSFSDFFESAFDPQYQISEARWQRIRANRRMLFQHMIAAGFVNFRNEWWHYDLGDGYWARQFDCLPLFASMEAELQTGVTN